MRIVFALAGVVIRELYRRKDVYVLLILTLLITALLGSLNFFNDDHIVRYLEESCMLLIWVCSLVIAVTTTARQIPAEREQRTLFPLLAKPVTRGQVVLGKFVGCWLACWLVLVVFYLIFIGIGLSRDLSWSWVCALQALWLHGWLLAMVIALVLLGSVVFSAPSANVTISLLLSAGLLTMGRYLRQVAMGLTEPGQTLLSLAYFLLPHLEFFDLRARVIHHWDPVPWTICGLATLYALAYTCVLLLGAWWVFRRQTLN